MPASLSCPVAHPPTANCGIVLQAGKVLVHLLLLCKRKKKGSLFYSAVCWETFERSLWSYTKKVVWGGQPICWGQLVLGGAIEPGCTWDPKWSKVLILVGSRDERPKTVLVLLGTRPEELISHLSPLMRLKIIWLFH